MIKCECICSNCKEVLQAWQGEDGQVVPGAFTIDFLNKRIAYLCPKCGHENVLELGTIDKAVKEQKALPRISGTRF